MNQVKFDLMVREFPFLAQVFTQQHLSHDSVGNITVHRGDKNLLEVTPEEQSLSDGFLIDFTKSRQFWFVTDTGEIGELSSSFWRAEAFHGRNHSTEVSPIGVQLMVDRGSVEALRRVAYIVEVSGENWDTWIEKWYVGIYKMQRFDWVSFCRSFNLRFAC